MLKKFSLEEAFSSINWKEIIVEGITLDNTLKQLSFDSRVYIWKKDSEFVGRDGFLHFCNLNEIISNPVIDILDLQNCRLAFLSYKQIQLEGLSYLELETSVTGNDRECEIGYLVIRISAEYIIWQPAQSSE